MELRFVLSIIIYCLLNKYVFYVFNVNGLYDRNRCEMNKQKWISFLGTNEKQSEISNNNPGSYLRLSRMQELHSLTSVNLAEALTCCCISKTKEEKSKVNSSSTVFLCIDLLIIFKLAPPYSYVYLNGQPEPYVLSSFAASLAVSE